MAKIKQVNAFKLATAVPEIRPLFLKIVGGTYDIFLDDRLAQAYADMDERMYKSVMDEFSKFYPDLAPSDAVPTRGTFGRIHGDVDGNFDGSRIKGVVTALNFNTEYSEMFVEAFPEMENLVSRLQGNERCPECRQNVRQAVINRWFSISRITKEYDEGIFSYKPDTSSLGHDADGKPVAKGGTTTGGCGSKGRPPFIGHVAKTMEQEDYQTIMDKLAQEYSWNVIAVTNNEDKTITVYFS